MIALLLALGCGHVERHGDAVPDSGTQGPDASVPDAGSDAASAPDASVRDAGEPDADAAPNPCAWPAYDGDPCDAGLCRDEVCDAESCFIEGRWYQDEELDPLTECRVCDVTYARTLWLFLPDGTACTEGICSEGGCAGF